MDDDSKFSYFFLGLGLGVAAGLLFAPKTGEETRDMIRSKADESKEFLRKRAEDLKDQANEALERGKSTVTRQRDNLSAAVEAGKQAYREAVTSTGNASERI